MTMPLAPIQDLVYQPAMSPMSRAQDEGEKKDGNWSWNPWQIGPILGTDKPSMPAEGHSLSGTFVRSKLTWDVKMPPRKKHMVGGYLVPTVRSKVQFMAQKNRRISIEIHGPSQSLDTTNESSVKHTMMQGLLQGDTAVSGMEKELLHDNENVFFRVLKKAKGARRHGHGHDDSSDGSSVQGGHAVSTLGGHGADEVDDDKDHQAWTESGSYKLEDVIILKSSGRSCEVRLGTSNEIIVRDIKFDSEKDRTSFGKVMDKLSTLERERAQRQVTAYKRIKKDAPSKQSNWALEARALSMLEEGTETINLLVEIVSAIDIPVADIYSSDPYVIVQMGGKEVHRTGIIPKSLDPIWTLNSGSLFLLQMTPEDFFSCAGGMLFTVKDYDAVGANELLGRVTLKLDELLNGTGERHGYDIVDKVLGEKNHGKLYLRFKEATPEDIEFMTVYQNNQKNVGVYLEETYLAPRPPDVQLLKRQSKRDEHKNVVRRVKPYPDPTRKDETTWLTDKQIEREAIKHSTNWTEAGSGELGKLYVEIIGCDNLPNLDLATLDFRDKTDAFACLIFEDTVVNTDVIGDSLSPRWMPWSRRAFVFNIDHPSSDLQIGLFDYDRELSPLQLVSRLAGDDLHDPVGRIQIHTSNFLANTVYTLKYNMFYGDLAKDRVKTRGTITVRMRINWTARKKALIASVMPPAPTYVSVARKIDFQVAHYTAEGMHDENKFDMNAFTRYIEELQSYETVLYYLKEAVLTVWLWRGHFDVNICGKKVALPLHSITAFVWGVLVTRDFNLLPSFLAFAIGWGFLACNEQTNRNPSPWHGRRHYGPLLLALLVDQGKTQTIVPNHNLEAIEVYNKAGEERKARLAKEREEEARHDELISDELGVEIGGAAAQDVDITTKRGGVLERVTLNPLKSVLHPIQLQLKEIVVAARIATSIILWEETFYAFWIVTISFAASVAMLLIPWGVLLRWIFRIIAWVFLGPWMAIVDRLYFRDKPNMTDEEKEESRKKRLRSRYEVAVEAASNYHVKRERAIKLQAMKKYMFGKFLIRVPRFREALYQDIPLPASFAEPYDASKVEAVVITDHKYGQNLFGDMVPQRDIQAAEALKSGTVSVSSGSKLKFWKRMGHSKSSEKTSERVPLLSRFGRSAHKEYNTVDGAANGESDDV